MIFGTFYKVSIKNNSSSLLFTWKHGGSFCKFLGHAILASIFLKKRTLDIFWFGQITLGLISDGQITVGLITECYWQAFFSGSPIISENSKKLSEINFNWCGSCCLHLTSFVFENAIKLMSEQLINWDKITSFSNSWRKGYLLTLQILPFTNGYF